jgi:hypothetical protein
VALAVAHLRAHAADAPRGSSRCNRVGTRVRRISTESPKPEARSPKPNPKAGSDSCAKGYRRSPRRAVMMDSGPRHAPCERGCSHEERCICPLQGEIESHAPTLDARARCSSVANRCPGRPRGRLRTANRAGCAARTPGTSSARPTCPPPGSERTTRLERFCPLRLLPPRATLLLGNDLPQTLSDKRREGRR